LCPPLAEVNHLDDLDHLWFGLRLCRACWDADRALRHRRARKPDHQRSFLLSIQSRTASICVSSSAPEYTTRSAIVMGALPDACPMASFAWALGTPLACHTG